MVQVKKKKVSIIKSMCDGRTKGKQFSHREIDSSQQSQENSFPVEIQR